MAKNENEGDRASRNHNQGERDAAEGKYDPPHGLLWNSTVGSDQDRADNKSYDKGYQNGKAQRR